MAHRYKGGSNNNRGTPLGFHKEGWNATLRVGMPHTYERASPELKSPLVVGGYSVDCNRKILHDRSKLQFIDETFLSEETIDVQLDLKKGMEKAIFYKGNSQESFENLLLWVLKNQDSLMSERSSQRLSADILCMRGTLKKICRSPYSSKSSWSILVAEFKGTYYIIPSTSKEGAGPNETTDTKQLWGNKFEQYLKGDSDDILDPNEEYRSVLKLTVGDFSLLYSPEIDCADPDVYQEDHKDMSAFVLVKMCKDATIESQDYYKKFRLSDWWLDNKLTGIPRIVVGSCTDSGIIHSIELMKTEDLPALGKNEWDPNVYINFLVSFFTFMEQKVREDTSAVFEFEHRSNGTIYCSKLSKPDSVFLPSWYTEKLFNKDKADK